MQVLKIINENNIALSYKIGKELGNDADGQCFELIDDKEKAIKLSIVYDVDFIDSIIDVYNEKETIFSYIKETQPQPYVRIHDYGLLHIGDRFAYGIKQQFVIYFVIMDKLNSISNDESKVFHYLLSKEDDGILPYSDKEFDEILKNMSRGLDFSEESVRLFRTRLANSSLSHNDIKVDSRGVRNIMKDKSGDFILIDLDRVTKKEKNNEY